MATGLPAELFRLLTALPGILQDDAWADFVATHSRLLFEVARSVTPSRDAAMDAYAQVLERLRDDDCRRLRGFAPEGGATFTTWLAVVARRLCLDSVRHRYGRPRDATSERAARRRLADLVADETDPDQLQAPGGDQAETLQTRELREALDAATAGLAVGDRLLLKLRFDDDLSARQIAAVLGLPTPFHVYRRLNLVLETLRRHLRERGVEDAEP